MHLGSYDSCVISGSIGKSGVAKVLQVQHAQLRDRIEKLKATETYGTSLVSDFTEAVNKHIEQFRSRLQVDIWDGRKIFTPHGHTLREVFSRRKNGRGVTYKLEQPAEDMLEGTLSGKCKAAVSAIAKEPQVVWHSLLRDGLENLSKAAETSGTTSVSDFRQAVVDERVSEVTKYHSHHGIPTILWLLCLSIPIQSSHPVTNIARLLFGHYKA